MAAQRRHRGGRRASWLTANAPLFLAAAAVAVYLYGKKRSVAGLAGYDAGFAYAPTTVEATGYRRPLAPATQGFLPRVGRGNTERMLRGIAALEARRW